MKYIFKPKLFSLLENGISKDQIVKDSLSGIIVGIVALPLAIAFAVASGVSPEKGLITAIVAGFIISFLGGSRVQIGGPTGAFIVIVYGIVTQYGIDGLIISTVLAGIILVIFGLLRLGSLLKFFPHSLVVGFTSGIALVIFSTQIKDAFGFTMEEVPSEFIEKWSAYASNISSFNLYAFLITVFTIITQLVVTKFTSKIPGAFVALIISTTAVAAFKMPVATIESVFGNIPQSFSFEMPNFQIDNISQYFLPALTIALLGGIESLLSAVVADGMISGNHRSNTELIAQGIANIVTPFFGGIPATGAIARTATNVKNGGRTPIAGITHAVTLLLIMFFLGQWAKLIPMSCLAGILIVVSYNMSEWRSFVSIMKGTAFDIIILLVTFSLTVLVDLVVAIEIGVVLSALLFMKRMADKDEKLPLEIDSDIIEHYEKLPKEIAVYEISGPLFFGTAKHYTETIKNLGEKASLIVIRMRHVPFIDATGCYNLSTVIDMLKNLHTNVYLSGINERVEHDLKKYGIIDKIGSDKVFSSFSSAIEKALISVKER